MNQQKNVITKAPSVITQNATERLLNPNMSSQKSKPTITKNATGKNFNVGSIRIPSLKIKS